MALSAATIKTTIKNALDAQYGTPKDAVEQEKFTTALANAIFDVLTNQATVSVASVSGVTTGPGVSGPGAGTIV